MVLALAQTNPVIGDLAANVAVMRERIAEAADRGAQLVLFPELAVCGYPPEDLLLRSDFLTACHEAVEEVAAASGDLVVVYGAPMNGPRDLHNSLVLAAGGEVRAVYDKVHLPHYGVFDERRYFGPGSGHVLVRAGGHLVALNICADLWVADGPATSAARAGAELILNASASPFHAGKGREREAMLAQRARDVVCPIAYANLWGGQDELVFDGGSMAVDHLGRVVARAEQFRDELLVFSMSLRPVRSARLRDPRLREGAPNTAGLDSREAGTLTDLELVPEREVAAAPVAPALAPEEELWQALQTGVRDHARATGHDHAVLGLGGGIDSSLVAVLACDALGPERVTCVVMPSGDPDADPSAEMAARELVGNLGCSLYEVRIDALQAAYESVLGPELDGAIESWEGGGLAEAQATAGAEGVAVATVEHRRNGGPPAVTEVADAAGGSSTAVTAERVTARIRSNMLMALSNAHGWLLLSTGNKSELACGYATLYGETFGGFAAIKDVPRSLALALARWRQGRDPSRPGPIPESIMANPHGGVRPDGWQLDGLPPFEEVDPIIQAYVEDGEDPDSLVARGHDPETVGRVIDLIERAEYKRRQAPPGIKISARAFGRDRRMPIAHGFSWRG